MGFPFLTPHMMPRMILNGGIVPLTSNRSLDMHSIVMTLARSAILDDAGVLLPYQFMVGTLI